MTGDWVGQYASVLGDALLPHRWPYAIAVDEWEVRTVRYRDDGTRVQRGSDHYVVMAVVGYPNSRDPGRLWKLAARPSNSQAHWDSVFAELDPRGDRPPTILVADGAWGAWNAAGARWPDIRRYRCAWHREERARKRLAKAGYRSNSEPLVRLLQRRTATGRVPCDIFTDPFAYLTFRLALREETARTGLAEPGHAGTHAQRGRRPHLARAARVAQAAHHRRRRGGARPRQSPPRRPRPLVRQPAAPQRAAQAHPAPPAPPRRPQRLRPHPAREPPRPPGHAAAQTPPRRRRAHGRAVGPFSLSPGQAAASSSAQATRSG